MTNLNIYLLVIILLIQIKSIQDNLNYEKIDEKINIEIISLSLPQASCIPNLSTFIYHIKVNFSSKPYIKSTLSIDLSSNIKSLCYPFENTSVTDSFFQCEINIVDYPINNKKIYLPLKSPISDYYNIINWDKISSKPITEKEIKCIPLELNAYKIDEIKKEGCSNNKNIISLKGKWKDESKQIPKNFEVTFDNLKGKCNIIYSNWTQCDIEGKGNTLFSTDYYFKFGINTFMIQKIENTININDCNNVCFIYIRKIFIFVLLLLLL